MRRERWTSAYKSGQGFDKGMKAETLCRYCKGARTKGKHQLEGEEGKSLRLRDRG